ncbi:MAG: AIR synthase-related protein, partial [Enterococcus faecalis]|nr:AIR synthase-related protein [Enterococcus faecalis]
AGLVASAHDCAEGGVAVALAESAFANELGLQVILPLKKEYLFAETQSRFILSVSPQHQEEFETLIGKKAQHIGKVTETGLVIHALDDVINCSTKEAKALWEDAIPCLMKQKA